MAWERARTKEQKEQRIAEIIEATARLYENHSFEEITLVSIAKEAKFTRSNLYKYFDSKEEIFFEFLKHDIVLWRQDLVKNFQKRKAYTIAEFASIWTTVQVRHKRMVRLIPILYDYLEKKASVESLIDFKRMAKDELILLSELLCRLFPQLSTQKAAEFLNMQLAASIGLYKMTNLSEAQKEVLAYHEFEHLRVDYEPYLKQSVEYLLHGLLYDS